MNDLLEIPVARLQGANLPPPNPRPALALAVLAVVGSLQRGSGLRLVVEHVVEQFREGGCSVDLLDLEREPLALYNPETTPVSSGYSLLQGRVEGADVLLLATPDYHGSVSGVLKNFLDHFWREFAGKLFVPIVASQEKGLTVTDQLHTVARQCYAWTLPYGVDIACKTDLKDGQVASDTLRRRLEMMVRDVRVYGDLLARQRRADLADTAPGFMARHRKAA